jgi:hypothetical protein
VSKARAPGRAGRRPPRRRRGPSPSPWSRKSRVPPPGKRSRRAPPTARPAARKPRSGRTRTAWSRCNRCSWTRGSGCRASRRFWTGLLTQPPGGGAPALAWRSTLFPLDVDAIEWKFTYRRSRLAEWDLSPQVLDRHTAAATSPRKHSNGAATEDRTVNLDCQFSSFIGIAYTTYRGVRCNDRQYGP